MGMLTYSHLIIIFTDAYCNINLWFEIGVVLFLTVVEDTRIFQKGFGETNF